MLLISRRQFGVGALSSAAVPSNVHAKDTAEEQDARAAIIDTTEDTRPWLQKLRHDVGVRVIGRYYSRGPQCADVPQKRLTFNDEEVTKSRNVSKALKCPNLPVIAGPSEAAALREGGFGILSIYQYNSSNPEKFLFGLNNDASVRTDHPSNTDHIRRAQEEADADADAALAQARDANQALGSAIYFGLDFNLHSEDDIDVRYGDSDRIIAHYDDGRAVRNDALKQAVEAYFKKLSEKIGTKYALGVYGCGYASEFLRDEKRHGKQLIKYTWISGSTAYARTPAVLRTNNWHLFQNKIDRRWFTTAQNCGAGFDVDTNIQNPGKTEFGAWKHGGELFKVNAKRTERIFNARRPAKSETAIVDAHGNTITAGRCFQRKPIIETTVKITRNVRVLATQNWGEKGTWLAVDIDEDGELDGYCRESDFSRSIKEMRDF
jgi:hypothetical protein